MTDFANSVSGVAAAISKMSLEKTTEDKLKEHISVWSTFGKMNSHLYRKWLMDLMTMDKLSGTEMFMVYFFFGVIKSQPRVLKALPNLPPDIRALPWFTKVQSFVMSRVVQYVTQAKDQSKFPAVNIPTTNPGMDILVYVLSTNQSAVSLDELTKRPTFTQLHLDTNLQNKAKVGYQFYWDNVITGTKNKETSEEPKYRDEYYNTSAADKYHLIKIKKDGSFSVCPPASESVGYIEKEITDYLKNFKE